MLSTASMTREQMIKRIAMRAEMVQQSSGVKVARTAEPYATLLLDALHDGIREFLRAHNWSFRLVTFTFALNASGAGALNVDGDARRMVMPAWVESLPKGQCYWRGPNGEPGGKVATRHFTQVMGAAYRSPDSTGEPCMIGAQWNPQLGKGLGEAGRIELAIDPKPDQAYQMFVPVKAGCIPMVADHQTGIWPAVHDLTVVEFAVRELFAHDKDMGEQDQARCVAAVEARLARLLQTSIENDDEDFRPQELGSVAEEVAASGGRLVRGYDLTNNGELLVQVASFS